MTPRDVPLPDDCRVRLVDLPTSAGGAIAVDADGFVTIYINARLSAEARRAALEHELRHHRRGDLYSDQDIRAIERGAEGITTLDGAPLRCPPPPFVSEGLRRVGRGLYLPEGSNLTRATEHILALRGALMDACRTYDVMQTPPLLPVDGLLDLAGRLGPGDIAFAAWQRLNGRPVPMLHFSREDLYGAIYYGPGGVPDNALILMDVGDIRLTVDVRRRCGRLEPFGITREIGGRVERVY
jgi:hypothetical protein